MPSDYYFGYYFFAPSGRFEPCGMFTKPHIISASICLIIIAISLILYRKFRDKINNQKILRYFAVTVTILELLKISHSFIYGDFHLDAWFPLSYCGLLIFALWMAGFGNETFIKAGYIFIAFGCPIAGLIFLISPSTSLMMFPVWHYFSVYSMLYHSIMIFSGIMLLMDINVFNTKDYLYYLFFLCPFMLISIIMNAFLECNLMLLRCPYNFPIQGIIDIYNISPYAYTLIAVITYAVIPLLSAFLSGKLLNKH